MLPMLPHHVPAPPGRTWYCLGMYRLATRTVRIGGARVKAEIADGPVSRMLGLMFRKRLAKDAGMLLCFRRSGDHAIHMMNVRFPLDVIFVSSAGRIVCIHRAVPGEWPFRAGKPVRYVLEVNAGVCRRHRIRIGDRCHLPG